MCIEKFLKKTVKILSLAVGGVILYENGSRKGYDLGFEEGYRKGYLNGGADMYDSHIYPEDGVTFDPLKDIED